MYISIYIPVLMASTGSNLEAEIAGKIPESKPIKAAKLVPKSMFLKLKTNSKSNAILAIVAPNHTKNIPITPPITESITASNKN